MSENHCKDCCCARSWEALGVTSYTGMSIVEHIERLRSDNDALAARLAEADALLREAGAPVRELLWCLTVWNDHNFTEADLIRKLRIARQALGLDGINRVDDANDLLTRIDAHLSRKEGET